DLCGTDACLRASSIGDGDILVIYEPGARKGPFGDRLCRFGRPGWRVPGRPIVRCDWRRDRLLRLEFAGDTSTDILYGGAGRPSYNAGSLGDGRHPSPGVLHSLVGNMACS